MGAISEHLPLLALISAPLCEEKSLSVLPEPSFNDASINHNQTERCIIASLAETKTRRKNREFSGLSRHLFSGAPSVVKGRREIFSAALAVEGHVAFAAGSL